MFDLLLRPQRERFATPNTSLHAHSLSDDNGKRCLCGSDSACFVRKEILCAGYMSSCEFVRRGGPFRHPSIKPLDPFTTSSLSIKLHSYFIPMHSTVSSSIVIGLSLLFLFHQISLASIIPPKLILISFNTFFLAPCFNASTILFSF